jgi:hypothetical protein
MCNSCFIQPKKWNECNSLIDIGVNEGLLGEGSSMKMNLPFDHAKKID